MLNQIIVVDSKNVERVVKTHHSCKPLAANLDEDSSSEE